MGLLDMFRRSEASAPEITAPAAPETAAMSEMGTAVMAYSLNDPFLLEFMRGGAEAVTGQSISIDRAMRNPSMFRAVSLISNSIGMLPMHLIERQTRQKAVKHPLFRILHRKPNNWQTAFDFRALMQMRALVKGDAYALVIWSRDIRTGQKILARIVPLDPDSVTPEQDDNWTVRYRYQPKNGGVRYLGADEVFHLRGLSLNGLNGISLVKQARDAIGIALAAEMAAGRLFKNGVMSGAALKHPAKLSQVAYDRLKESLAEKEGPENAGKSLIFEEGMDWATAQKGTARDSQLAEIRKLQVEEIARVTGVPRPLLMVDETSWGSGIEALGQFFVAYALNPWFEAWQQAVERTLLTDDEVERYAVKINPGALLRGSLKDQADFLSKALGAGGHAPWMHVDEVRDVMDLPEREAPPHSMMGHNGGPAIDDAKPDPKPKPKKNPPVEEDDDDE